MEAIRNPRWQYWQRLAVGIVLALTLVKVWFDPHPLTSAATAQIPDSGLQRKQLIDETKLTNELLADIKQILEKQTINVRVRSADNQSDAPIRNPSAGK